MIIYNDQFLMMSGTLMDSNYHAIFPLGGIFVVNKDDVGTVLTTSLRNTQNVWLPYDFDVSNSDNILLSLYNNAYG